MLEPTMFAGLPESQQPWAGDPAQRPAKIKRLEQALEAIKDLVEHEPNFSLRHQIHQICRENLNSVPPASAIAATQES